MKGDSTSEIARRDGVFASTVRVALTPLGVRFDARREHPTVPPDAKRAYSSQRAVARFRGIEWEFTPESWWRVWQESGKWELRGKAHGCYCMARHLDSGPYAEWNVRICPFYQNLAESRYVQACRLLGVGHQRAA